MIFGADPVASGGSCSTSADLGTTSPPAAARRVPEAARAKGTRAAALVGDNLVVSALRKLFPSGLFDPRSGQRTADGLIRQLRIATPSARQTVGLLSGGNQQKVVIGKWLAAGAKLFIFDEDRPAASMSAQSPRSLR